MDVRNNETLKTFFDGDNTSDVLYFGVSGFGITWSYLLVHLALLFIGFTGLTFNVFCFVTLRNKKSWMDISVIFITNLTCSDIIMDVSCIYIVIYNLVHYKNYYECAFRLGLVTGIALNSSLQLLALTLDRYVKILHPYEYVRVFKEGSAKLFCTASWFIAVTIGLLPIIGVRRSPVFGLEYCSFFGVLTNTYLIISSVCFYSVLLSLVLCYIQIISVAWTQTKMCSKDRINKHLWWKPTKTVLVLIVFYVLCWLPMSVCIILHLTGGYPKNFTDDMKGTVLAYGSSLVYLDTIANPVIYALKIKTVRQRFNRVKNVILRIKKSESDISNLNFNRSRSIPHISENAMI